MTATWAPVVGSQPQATPGAQGAPKLAEGVGGMVSPSRAMAGHRLSSARGPPSAQRSTQNPLGLHDLTHRETALTQYGEEIPFEELEQEQASELPGRDLLVGISLLGIPLLGLDGLTVAVNTSGPNWLLSA